MKNYKGYSLFLDVGNPRLRTWNRCSTFFTIFKDHGKSMAEDYVAQLDDISKRLMLNLFEEIREKGLETTKASVIRGL